MSTNGYWGPPPTNIASGAARLRAMYEDFNSLSADWQRRFWTDVETGRLISLAIGQLDVIRMIEAGFQLSKPTASGTEGLLLTAVSGKVKIQKICEKSSKIAAPAK